MRRSHKTLSPDRVRELKRLAERVDREERQRLSRKARVILDEHAALLNAVQLLKSERERLGLSLADVAERSGIDKGNLSRLESAAGNPTIDTLSRYAAALGRKLRIDLAA